MLEEARWRVHLRWTGLLPRRKPPSQRWELARGGGKRKEVRASVQPTLVFLRAKVLCNF
jgi:hypothetical protein